MLAVNTALPCFAAPPSFKRVLTFVVAGEGGPAGAPDQKKALSVILHFIGIIELLRWMYVLIGHVCVGSNKLLN